MRLELYDDTYWSVLEAMNAASTHLVGRGYEFDDDRKMLAHMRELLEYARDFREVSRPRLLTYASSAMGLAFRFAWAARCASLDYKSPVWDTMVVHAIYMSNLGYTLHEAYGGTPAFDYKSSEMCFRSLKNNGFVEVPDEMDDLF